MTRYVDRNTVKALLDRLALMYDAAVNAETDDTGEATVMTAGDLVTVTDDGEDSYEIAVDLEEFCGNISHLQFTTSSTSGNTINLCYYAEYFDFICTEGAVVTYGDDSGALKYTFSEYGTHDVYVKVKSGLTDLKYMFQNCTYLTAVLDTKLFAYCDTVKSFSSVFRECSSLVSIPEGMFDPCVGATAFGYTFYNCSSLEQIPTGLFDLCENVTSFGYTFYGCSSLVMIPDGLFSNNKLATGFGSTFCGCSAIKTMPQDLFLYNTAATTFQKTFYGCSNLTVDVYIGSSDVTNASYFAQGSKAVGVVYVPADSTTYETFNSESLAYRYVTIETY